MNANARKWGRGRCKVVAAFVALGFAASMLTVAARAETVAERAVLDAAYRAQLEELAVWGEGQQLVELARQVRAWPLPDDKYTLAFALPAAQASPLHERFQALREAQAQQLFQRAQAAARGGDTTAFELMHRALRENPDHEAARRALGYTKFEGHWLTRYEVTKAQGKQVWDDRFGWQLRDRLVRYERGERFYRGRWMSATDEARLVTDVASGWDVTTEHFRVRTNHSLAAGVALAARLERFYAVWQQMFARYYLSEADLARLAEATAPKPGTPRRHEVLYYRNRDEYNAALAKTVPDIARSTGYYDTDARQAHFFAGTDEDPTAIYHEATHQLLAEVRSSRAQPGAEANFWVVEGIACYLESLVEHPGYALVGGREPPRLKAAKFRLLVDDSYVPLAELTTFGRDRLQRDERLSMLYSQASGLTHFLMHDHDGQYRAALMDYLTAIYTGRDMPQTLADLTRTSYPDFDAQYRAFIKSLAKF